LVTRMRVGWTFVGCSPAGFAYSIRTTWGAEAMTRGGGDNREDAADVLGDVSMMQ
jgi:hypothetical protein